MNSALSVFWGAVGCCHNRPLLQCLVTIGITRSLRPCGPKHRLGNTRRRRPLRRLANLLRAAESPPGNGHSELPLHVPRGRWEKLLDKGWLGCGGDDPTHSGISRLDLGVECDPIPLALNRCDCDDRHRNESCCDRSPSLSAPPGRGRLESRGAFSLARPGQERLVVSPGSLTLRFFP